MKHDIREMTFEKPLPSNPEAERFVIGAGMLDIEKFEQAANVLLPDMFTVPSHQAIFRAMSKLFESSRPIDPVAIAEQLRLSGELERIGGPAQIAHEFDDVPRFMNIENYVSIIRDVAKERRLITFGNLVMSRGFNGDESVDEQIRQAELDLAKISDGRGESHWRTASGVAFEVLTEAERRAASGRDILDFSTGFGDLDYMTLGLERKTVVVIGAAPGMGKSAFALAMTRGISESLESRGSDGLPPVIAWFSQEMPAEQMLQRLIASEARVDSTRLRLGKLSADEWRRVAAATQRIGTWRVHFDDRAGISPRKMREAIRRLRSEEGRVDIVIVDYLQMSDGERQKGETRESEVARISRGYTQIAKDYNLTLIALSQLNREIEKRTDKRPHLGDFRDSGQIAQDAYLLIGLYCDDVYNPASAKQNIAEVIILKQRNGPLGTVELVFLRQIMRFEERYRGESAF